MSISLWNLELRSLRWSGNIIRLYNWLNIWSHVLNLLDLKSVVLVFVVQPWISNFLVDDVLISWVIYSSWLVKTKSINSIKSESSLLQVCIIEPSWVDLVGKKEIKRSWVQSMTVTYLGINILQIFLTPKYYRIK